MKIEIKNGRELTSQGGIPLQSRSFPINSTPRCDSLAFPSSQYGIRKHKRGSFLDSYVTVPCVKGSTSTRHLKHKRFSEGWGYDSKCARCFSTWLVNALSNVAEIDAFYSSLYIHSIKDNVLNMKREETESKNRVNFYQKCATHFVELIP